MRSRHRKSRRPRRLEQFVLNVRTAAWLGKLLWRPTLLGVIGRTRRIARF
jgi:hypothetical protein